MSQAGIKSLTRSIFKGSVEIKLLAGILTLIKHSEI